MALLTALQPKMSAVTPKESGPDLALGQPRFHHENGQPERLVLLKSGPETQGGEASGDLPSSRGARYFR